MDAYLITTLQTLGRASLDGDISPGHRGAWKFIQMLGGDFSHQPSGYLSSYERKMQKDGCTTVDGRNSAPADK